MMTISNSSLEDIFMNEYDPYVVLIAQMLGERIEGGITSKNHETILNYTLNNEQLEKLKEYLNDDKWYNYYCQLRQDYIMKGGSMLR